MNPFSQLPTVTKNIIIINAIVFLAQNLIPGFTENFQLHFYQSPGFQPIQILTHMFMHSPYSLSHIFFNMFAVFMFGPMLEYRLGTKRFLMLYLLTGFGGTLLYTGSSYYENLDAVQYLVGLESHRIVDYNSLLTFFPEQHQLAVAADLYREGIIDGEPITDAGLTQLFKIFTHPVLGASGAVFGLLAAFASLFPNQRLFLFFIPVPIKAKHFVLGYSAIELYSGVVGREDGVAHFAHVGGALFGYLIIREWRKKHLI